MTAPGAPSHSAGPAPSFQLIDPGTADEATLDTIWNILTVVDREFVPPLSARSGTLERRLTQESIWGGPVSYFDQLTHQHVVLARVGAEPAAIMSFIRGYHDDALADWSPSTYVSTTAVLPRFRRRGLGAALNEYVEHQPETIAGRYVSRRTWSTNTGNLALLAAAGYTEAVRIPDDRGPGVDTVYFVKDLRAS